jgi:hypothetical protein
LSAYCDFGGVYISGSSPDVLHAEMPGKAGSLSLEGDFCAGASASVIDASRRGPGGPLLSMKLPYVFEKTRNFILRSFAQQSVSKDPVGGRRL